MFPGWATLFSRYLSTINCFPLVTCLMPLFYILVTDTVAVSAISHGNGTNGQVISMFTLHTACQSKKIIWNYSYLSYICRPTRNPCNVGSIMNLRSWWRFMKSDTSMRNKVKCMYHLLCFHSLTIGSNLCSLIQPLFISTAELPWQKNWLF